MAYDRVPNRWSYCDTRGFWGHEDGGGSFPRLSGVYKTSTRTHVGLLITESKISEDRFHPVQISTECARMPIFLSCQVVLTQTGSPRAQNPVIRECAYDHMTGSLSLPYKPKHVKSEEHLSQDS